MRSLGDRDMVNEDALEASPAESDRTRPWIQAIVIVMVTRAVFLVVAWAVASFTADSAGPPGTGLDIWARWDATLFARVAEFGYTAEGTDPHATAFFPLFPLLLRAVSAIGFSQVVAGMLITTVAMVVATAYLYRLVEEEVGPGAGRRAALYLAFFPTAVFLVAPYSEAVFLAGAIPAFYYARRAEWSFVAIPTMVAMGARFAGVFLIFGLALEFLRQRTFTKDKVVTAAAAMFAGLGPLFAYAAYLSRIKGDAWYFFVDQREGWGRMLVTPKMSFLNTWQTWEGADYPTNFVVAWRAEILAAAIGLGFVAWALKRREWGYAGYMAAFLATLMTSTWYFSIPRMLVSFFPIVILLAYFSHERPERHEYVLLTLVPLSILGVVVFTDGAWFF